MMMKPILWAFTAVVGVLVLFVCTSLLALSVQPESPEVLLVNITPLDTTMFEQRLLVNLRVRNPNDFGLEVTGLDFSLHLNDQRLARGLTNKSTTIPRLGDSILSIETTTTTLDLVRQLLNLAKRQDVTYLVDGVLYLHGSRLPFENKGVLIDSSQFSSSSPNP